MANVANTSALGYNDEGTSSKLTNPKLPPPMSIAQHEPGVQVRSGHLNLDTFSPVNQNGSFAFDRVLKSGEVQKRTRKTKQWKTFYLVLRPNLLSIYKSSSEERLLKQLSLSELTTVAYQRDPKGRRLHVFSLFSPSKNYHFEAKTEAEAESWVGLIRKEARVDERVPDAFLSSNANEAEDGDRWESERLGSSSPEPDLPPQTSTTRDGIRIPGARRPSTHGFDSSGDELGQHSDFSDTPPWSVGSFPHQKIRDGTGIAPALEAEIPHSASHSGKARNAGQMGGFPIEQDEERVLWHGYLYSLKTKGGVKQWKKLWVVLRAKNLAFYKNEEEYAARLIISLSSIIDAVEIDPVTKHKAYCMQVITDDKNYRLCAPSEEALARWLGALKSQLMRKKEGFSKAQGAT